MTLHEQRIAQIRHRIEAGEPIPGDAEYLLAALDAKVREQSRSSEDYRFGLVADAVVDPYGRSSDA
jgi:hypothetical protein